MKQIQDSLLERYKARQVKKLAIGGWMRQDWTGTKKPMSVEDQQLNGIDVTTNFNSYGTNGPTPVAASTQPTREFTDGFGDSMTVGEEGSGLTTKQGSSLMAGVVNVGTGAIMAANKKNNNPNSKYTNAGYYKTQGAASSAMSGASMGASFGPIGIAAGAVIGGVAGYALGAKKDKQAARDFSADQAEFRKMRSIERDGRSAQQGLFQNGSASQYYKNGGKLWKPGTAPAKVNYDGLATTEYNEPNMPFLDPTPIANIGIQTALDQSGFGKGVNFANTLNDWRKRPGVANTVNLGLEGVKLGIGPAGDALVNTAQEVIYNYTDPKTIAEANQYGMPGNAARGPAPLKKPFKSTPTKVPTSSSTAVSRPLKKLAAGGSLLDNFKRTSSSTAEVHGPSHEQGGVQVPGMPGVEVEGKETLAGDYVFSDELGFAKLHKPIARAKGKVEKKPATRERLNTLKLLNEKENNLKLMQEYVKSKNNLQ